MIWLAIGLAMIAALVGVFLLGRWIERIEGRLTDHEKKLQAQQAAQVELEEILSGKRHTESTVAGIEDLLAVLMRVLIEENMHAQSRNYWIQRAQEIGQQLREGPRAYPVDAPTGNRRELVRYQNGGNGNGKAVKQ